MPTVKTTPTRYAIHYEDESPIFGESTIHVSIDDEAAGPYLVIESTNPDGTDGKVTIDFAQWPSVCDVVKHLTPTE